MVITGIAITAILGLVGIIFSQLIAPRLSIFSTRKQIRFRLGFTILMCLGIIITSIISIVHEHAEDIRIRENESLDKLWCSLEAQRVVGLQYVVVFKQSLQIDLARQKVENYIFEFTWANGNEIIRRAIGCQDVLLSAEPSIENERFRPVVRDESSDTVSHGLPVLFWVGIDCKVNSSDTHPSIQEFNEYFENSAIQVADWKSLRESDQNSVKRVSYTLMANELAMDYPFQSLLGLARLNSMKVCKKAQDVGHIESAELVFLLEGGTLLSLNLNELDYALLDNNRIQGSFAALSGTELLGILEEQFRRNNHVVIDPLLFTPRIFHRSAHEEDSLAHD